MISAVILTHNNKESIARTLESLKWCDEIIIIDDDSKDKTFKVVQKFKAKIFRHALNNDFAQQRNLGLTKARGEWVLFVDSDEVVSKELAQEISSKIKEQNGISGYFVKRRDWMWGRWLAHGEMGRIKLLRLGKKDTGRWRRAIHEVWDVEGNTEELENPLLHYPHPNVAQFLKEINYYSSINADYLYQQGIRAHAWQIVIYPVAKFCVNYFCYLGFLDGTAGSIVAIMMSFHSFLTRSKLWLLSQPAKVKF